MPATITIVTPENVELTYELAGIGTRSVSAMVDLLIHAILYTLLFLIGLGLYDAGVRIPDALTPWIVGGVLILAFLLFWGYYILFETRWSGQTPGKRLMRIRVIKDGGYPIDFRAAMLRNLMRYVDWLPAFYAAGVTSIFFSRDYKRLGDFVAGTLVVRERLAAAPERLVVPQPGAAPAEPPPFEVSRLTHAEYLTVRHYLDRRSALPEATRDRLAERLASPLIARLEWRQGERPADVQTFLETLARWYERTHGV